MQKQEKEVLIEEIMDIMNSHHSARHSIQDSLRFSEDYNLSIRGTLRDQYDEIDFKFLDQQDRLEEEMRNSIKKQEGVLDTKQGQKVETFGRNRQVIVEHPNEGVAAQRRKIKSKNSMKLSQQVKKKVSLRDNPDEFTKKYDNLFDEIFFKQKLKETGPDQSYKRPNKQQTIQHQKIIKQQPKQVPAASSSASNTGNVQTQAIIAPTMSILLESTITKETKIAQSENVQSICKHNEKAFLPNSKSLEETGNSLNLKQPKYSESELPTNDFQSTNSLSSVSEQSTDYNLLNKQIFQVLVQKYGQNPRLIESLKPQVRINYNEIKPLITIKPAQVQPSPTIRVAPAIRINHNPTIRISPSNKTIRVSPHPLPVGVPHHTIRISPNKTLPQIKTNPVSPQINFNYRGLPTFIVPKEAQKNDVYCELKQNQEIRLPIFLRKLRELTSSYPNFYFKQTLNMQNCNSLKKDLISAFQEVKKGIKRLKAVHLKYHQLLQVIKRLYKEMSNNLNSSKKNDLKTLEFFKSNAWKVEQAFPELQEIKPHQIFLKRELNQLQFMTLLNSFEQMVNNMEQEPLLDLENPKTFITYMNCRQKLWNIEKNMRIMSEDFYLKSILKISLPAHISESHEILNKKRTLNEQERNRQIQRLNFLKQHKDIFASCCLGKQTLKTLLEK